MAGLEIEGYDDIEMIGRGGFATVYAATQARFGRRVALKVLDVSLDDNGRRRFERECLATGSLSHHPNVVTIYDAGETADGRPYLALEHLPGGSLQARLAATGPLDPGDAIEIGAVLADALVAAHDAGILHRDIKPANILLTADGTPKLADFGISRLTGDPRYAGASTTSYSPAHVAPEQLANPDADPAADVYSLASTLFALIEARPPHATTDSDTLHQLITRKVTGEPPIWGDRIHEPLKSTLAAALDPDPARRPSMAVLAGQLHALASSDDHTIARTTRRANPTEVPAPTNALHLPPATPPSIDGSKTPDTIIRTTPATPTGDSPSVVPPAIADRPTPPKRVRRTVGAPDAAQPENPIDDIPNQPDEADATSSQVRPPTASEPPRSVATPDEGDSAMHRPRRGALMITAIVIASVIGAPLAIAVATDDDGNASSGSPDGEAPARPLVDPSAITTLVDPSVTAAPPLAPARWLASTSGPGLAGSADGTTWHQDPDTDDPHPDVMVLAGGGDQWLALGPSAQAARNLGTTAPEEPVVTWTSQNGYDWTELSTVGLDDVDSYSVSTLGRGNGRWVLLATTWLGDGSGAAILYSSADGVAWTAFDPGPQVQLGAVAFGNGQWVAVGTQVDDEGSATGQVTLTSADGVTWNKVVAASDFLFPNSLIWNGSAFLGVGTFLRGDVPLEVFATSTDGTSWAANTSTKPEDGDVRGHAGGGGVWLTSRFDGSDSWIEWSTDAVTWTRVDGLEPYTPVTFGDGRWLGCASGDGLIESGDGLGWTPVPGGPDCYSISHLS